jgi:predicted nucleic acid-binding protein
MIAVDTNVLIYACDQSDPRRQSIALDLIAACTDGVLLWQVACEFLAASRKLSKQGFTSTHAWSRLSEFQDLFPLVLPAATNLTRARELHISHAVLYGTRSFLRRVLKRAWMFSTPRICQGSRPSRPSV